MLGTIEKKEGAESSSRSCAGNHSFDFSSWTSLPPFSPVKIESRDTAVDPRPFERAMAVLMLAMATPLLVLIALAIKIESPRGPVFYRQERVGLNRRGNGGNGSNGGKGSTGGNGSSGGRSHARSGSGPLPGRSERRQSRGLGQPFMVWKFRTMIPDAEAKTGAVWAAKDDPRITRVGHVLRKLRLDEAPQLINVVRGNMRIIGPRPERPQFVERLSEAVPEYARRLNVPPGITGLAQVQRSYDTDLNDVRTKLKYDIYYVENRSPMLDLKILMKTFDVVVRGHGAH